MTRRLFEHLAEVNVELGETRPIWLGTDFDGTLTHHQNDPATVELPEAMRTRLATLAAHPRFAVAVISGRSLDDLMPRVGLKNAAYAGNHGLELAAAGLEWIDPAAMQSRSELNRCAVDVAEILRGVPGVRLENKQLSLAIDYRPCPLAQRADIVERLDQLATRFPALRMRHALLGSEVLPRTSSSKGTAARILNKHQLAVEGTAIYLGDDVTDEDAFRELSDGITIHVGERETAARFRLESAEQVADFFDWLSQF